MKESCASCKFWVVIDNTEGLFGNCHRYPANILMDDEYVHPEIISIDWCGEYKPNFIKEKALIDDILGLNPKASAEAVLSHSPFPESSYDVGFGTVTENSLAVYRDELVEKCVKVISIYQDGDVHIKFPDGSYDTVKWRFVVPFPN